MQTDTVVGGRPPWTTAATDADDDDDDGAEQASAQRSAPQRSARLSALDAAGVAHLIVEPTLRLSRRFGGVLTLPEMRFAWAHSGTLRQGSRAREAPSAEGDDDDDDDDDDSSARWEFTLVEVGDPSLAERVLGWLLPLARMRRLLLERFRASFSLYGGGAVLELRGDVTGPALGGLLTRLARLFVRDRLGSVVKLFGDGLTALADDLDALRATRATMPPREPVLSRGEEATSSSLPDALNKIY